MHTQHKALRLWLICIWMQHTSKFYGLPNGTTSDLP